MYFTHSYQFSALGVRLLGHTIQSMMCVWKFHQNAYRLVEFVRCSCIKLFNSYLCECTTFWIDTQQHQHQQLQHVACVWVENMEWQRWNQWSPGVRWMKRRKLNEKKQKKVTHCVLFNANCRSKAILVSFVVSSPVLFQPFIG